MKRLFSTTLSQNSKREILLSIESSDLTEAVVEPSELILNESNWFVPVSFTITGLQDGIVDGDVQYKLKNCEDFGIAV